ncbi:MAG: hypothetical protein J6Y54_07610 [Lentisphaeria bacterium]|nr:hypothetical protein [Lentisphaeria bacterium]
MKRALLLGALFGVFALAAESRSLTIAEGTDFLPKGIVKQDDGLLRITTNDGFRTIPAKMLKIDPDKTYELKCELKLADAETPVRSVIVAVTGCNANGQGLVGTHVSAVSGTETEVLEDAPKGAASLKLKITAAWTAIPKGFRNSFSLAIGTKEKCADLPSRRLTAQVKTYACSADPSEITLKQPLAFPVAAGTRVRVHLDQASFGVATQYIRPTAEWKSHTIKILPRQEYAEGKVISGNCWWPGVESAGIYFSVRTGGKKIPAGSGVLIRNISHAEVE